MLGLGSAIGLGAGLGGISSAYGNISHGINSISDYYFGGKSEKRSNERAESMSRRNMIFESLLDAKMASEFYYPLEYRYAGKMADLNKQIYDWESQYDYDMARRYGENSASWMVEGLRRAGLNPILAATDGNFRSTYGDSPSMGASLGSLGASHGGSRHLMNSSGGHWASPASSPDISASVANISSASNTLANAETVSALRPYTVDSAKNNAFNSYAQGAVTLATADKIKADANQVRANTARTLVDIDHSIDTGGVHSLAGLASAALHAFIPDFRSHSTRSSIRKAVNDEFESHSAKQQSLDSARKDYFKDSSTESSIPPSAFPTLEQLNKHDFHIRSSGRSFRSDTEGRSHRHFSRTPSLFTR